MIEESEDESLNEWYRRYAILALTKEEINCEEYWHSEFCKYVGDHFDCKANSTRVKTEATMPQSEWDKFYVPYKEKYKQDYTGNEVLGWVYL